MPIAYLSMAEASRIVLKYDSAINMDSSSVLNIIGTAISSGGTFAINFYHGVGLYTFAKGSSNFTILNNLSTVSVQVGVLCAKTGSFVGSGTQIAAGASTTVQVAGPAVLLIYWSRIG